MSSREDVVGRWGRRLVVPGSRTAGPSEIPSSGQSISKNSLDESGDVPQQGENNSFPVKIHGDGAPRPRVVEKASLLE